MMERIEERLGEVRQRIRTAAERAGREEGAIRLIAASKKQTVARLREAIEAGQMVFGENRLQEGKEKVGLLPGGCEWHFIGGLQKNKVRDVVRLFGLIHSVDSRALIEEVQKRAAAQGKIQQILIEVNVGGEANKHGARPEEAGDLVEYANAQPSVEVHGLMTVAPFCKDVEETRPYFARIRELRDDLEGRTGCFLPELSMGMTHDFEVAIEEGATMIRVGTGIFGERGGA